VTKNEQTERAPHAGPGAQPEGAGAENAAAALRVVRGTPAPEELAALVAVLAARAAAGGAGTAEPQRPASGWTDRARYVRSGRLEFGAGTGWRASALPR
jgi:hypothetical protein